MARFEQDREDLMREAVRLVPRGEFLLPGCPEPVFVGFRHRGGPSFYFGPEEVYQFNAAGQLRRAFYQGVLYKAQERKLVRMVRRRTGEETQLVSRPLNEVESRQFLERMHDWLARLAQALREGKAVLRQQVPPEGDLPERLEAWLAQHPQPGLARSPRALESRG